MAVSTDACSRWRPPRDSARRRGRKRPAPCNVEEEEALWIPIAIERLTSMAHFVNPSVALNEYREFYKGDDGESSCTTITRKERNLRIALCSKESDFASKALLVPSTPGGREWMERVKVLWVVLDCQLSVSFGTGSHPNGSFLQTGPSRTTVTKRLPRNTRWKVFQTLWVLSALPGSYYYCPKVLFGDWIPFTRRRCLTRTRQVHNWQYIDRSRHCSLVALKLKLGFFHNLWKHCKSSAARRPKWKPSLLHFLNFPGVKACFTIAVTNASQGIQFTTMHDICA